MCAQRNSLTIGTNHPIFGGEIHRYLGMVVIDFTWYFAKYRLLVISVSIQYKKNTTTHYSSHVSHIGRKLTTIQFDRVYVYTLHMLTNLTFC